MRINTSMMAAFFTAAALATPSYGDSTLPPSASTTTTPSSSTTGSTSGPRVCLDTDLVQATLNRLYQGMHYADAAAAMVCAGTAGAPYTDSLGLTVTPYTWTSPNKSVLIKFRNDMLLDIVRGGLPDNPATNSPVSFDTGTNVLQIPALNAAGQTYYNLMISMPPGGRWELTAASDAQGNALPVQAQTPATSVALSGTIANYYGINEGTLFTLNGQLWRGKAGCSFPAPASATSGGTGTGSAPATASNGISATPAAIIYKIATDYVLTISGSATFCNVERLM